MIADNILQLKQHLPDGVSLVAVSKLKTVEDIMQAYSTGHRLFGENYPLELRDKHAALPTDIQWHFLGHIQSKQIKYYIDFVSLIESVDSIEHLSAINTAAQKVGRVVDCLLEYHIASEESKHGFSLDEDLVVPTLANVRICGIMGVASHTPDTALVAHEFASLHSKFLSLKETTFGNCPHFSILSMGMSADYPIAIMQGSNMVRIGSTIFGKRDYNKDKRIIHDNNDGR